MLNWTGVDERCASYSVKWSLYNGSFTCTSSWIGITHHCGCLAYWHWNCVRTRRSPNTLYFLMTAECGKWIFPNRLSRWLCTGQFPVITNICTVHISHLWLMTKPSNFHIVVTLGYESHLYQWFNGGMLFPVLIFTKSNVVTTHLFPEWIAYIAILSPRELFFIKASPSFHLINFE